eukprot:3037165-Rhodomonas_salina.1
MDALDMIVDGAPPSLPHDKFSPQVLPSLPHHKFSLSPKVAWLDRCRFLPPVNGSTCPGYGCIAALNGSPVALKRSIGVRSLMVTCVSCLNVVV